MEALKQMGETPVIALDPNSQYNPGGDTPDTAEFNRNWARGMMTHTMNQYIESNYMYDRYQYRGYAVNVEPITDWNKTDIIPIYMALDRNLETPLLASLPLTSPLPRGRPDSGWWVRCWGLRLW